MRLLAYDNSVGATVLGIVIVLGVAAFWGITGGIAKLFGWKPGGKIENHKPDCGCDRCVEARESISRGR